LSLYPTIATDFLDLEAAGFKMLRIHTGHIEWCPLCTLVEHKRLESVLQSCGILFKAFLEAVTPRL
jgi:hypothetical protein